MNLSPHFTLAELTYSDTAERLGINNRPGEFGQDNLRRLADKLEQVRSILSAPIIVTSGYRCAQLNRQIGSGSTSAHIRGLAADFRAPAFGTPREVAEVLALHADELDFNQLIYEGTWVHFALADAGVAPRRLVLTAKFMHGTATYSKGIV